jgi:TctA family transporter
MIKDYFQKMKGTTTSPPRVSISEIVWSWVGAFVGIGFIAVAMGAFGMGEVLASTQESTEGRTVQKVKLRELLPTSEELRSSWAPSSGDRALVSS